MTMTKECVTKSPNEVKIKQSNMDYFKRKERKKKLEQVKINVKQILGWHG